MGQIIVRNLDDSVIERLKHKARRERTSLEQVARTLLTEAAKPSRAESVEAARRLRERIGRVSGDSTALIREDRDNDDLYRLSLTPRWPSAGICPRTAPPRLNRF